MYNSYVVGLMWEVLGELIMTLFMPKMLPRTYVYDMMCYDERWLMICLRYDMFTI